MPPVVFAGSKRPESNESQDVALEETDDIHDVMVGPLHEALGDRAQPQHGGGTGRTQPVTEASAPAAAEPVGGETAHSR